MNLFSFTGLFIGISSLFFGLFVYLKNRNKKENRLWLIFCASVAIWGFGGYRIGLIPKGSAEIAVFWWRVIHIGIIFIPIFFLHFIYVWLKIKQRVVIYLSYFIGGFFLLTNLYDLFIKPSAGLFISEVTWLFNSFYWDTHYHFNLYWIYLFLWLFGVLYAHYILFKIYKRIHGIQQTQIKYFLFAFIVSYAGGSTCYLPCVGINLYPIFNLTVPFYPFLMSYAIVKHRFMDIRVVIKRGAVFTGLVIAVTAAYVLLAFMMGWVFFGGAYTLKSQLITGLIVAIATAAGFIPLTNWLRKSTDEFLFKGTYNPQELLADISNILSRTLDLDKVIKILKGKVSRALRISKMEVLVISSKNIMSKENKTKKEKEIALSLNKVIDYFLRKQKEILILEELKRKYADKIKFHYSFLLIKDIETIGSNVIVPLYIKKKLVGLFLIGNKKSGDMFSVEDVRTLETIASQAAIAVENARLYEEMKNFSRKLELEVKRQTRSLRDANEKLKELDKAKSLFISLASHQLRTPLTAIKGYISMLLEKSWGALKPEQEKQLKKVFASSERLIKLVEDLLALSRIESGRFEFKMKKLSLEELIQDLIQELKETVQKKGLYIRSEKPAKPMSLVKVDALKTRQIFQNLIDNAIHYTEKGGITIGFKQVGDKIVVSVKDTGVGISEKDKTTLFEKFSRGKDANKLFTEGTGLGLYFSNKLVKAHKGDIWVESEGVGKGSTFFVALPITD